MGRFLFVVPPFAGHVSPTVPVGRELAARGHRVAWIGHPEVVHHLLPDDAVFLPVDTAVPQQVRRATAMRPVKGLRGPAALKFFWEDVMLPLARSMVPGVRAAVDGFMPDVVVADQQALAGAAVAQQQRVPWATTMTTSAELADPLGTMPLVSRWVRGLLRDLLTEIGLEEDEAAALDPRFSPQLVVAFSTERLMGSTAVPANCAFVGPCFAARGDAVDEPPFDWGWLDGRPLVLVEPGSTAGAAGGAAAGLVGDYFPAIAVDALSALDAQGVVVAPGQLSVSAPNVMVTRRAPRTALLERASVVVSHGDNELVSAALRQAVPLVVVPVRDDQPIVADQVVSAGAGVRVRFGRVRVEGLRRAIETALADPQLRTGAAQVRESFVQAGGSTEAADRIEGLLGTATLTAASLRTSRESA